MPYTQNMEQTILSPSLPEFQKIDVDEISLSIQSGRFVIFCVKSPADKAEFSGSYTALESYSQGSNWNVKQAVHHLLLKNKWGLKLVLLSVLISDCSSSIDNVWAGADRWAICLIVSNTSDVIGSMEAK